MRHRILILAFVVLACSFAPRSFAAVMEICGDFDSDGAVHNGDLTLLLNNWAQPVPPIPAGWSGMPHSAPAIDNDELTCLLNNWSMTVGGGAGTQEGSPLPEPSTLALLTLSFAFGTLGLRRRR